MTNTGVRAAHFSQPIQFTSFSAWSDVDPMLNYSRLLSWLSSWEPTARDIWLPHGITTTKYFLFKHFITHTCVKGPCLLVPPSHYSQLYNTWNGHTRLGTVVQQHDNTQYFMFCIECRISSNVTIRQLQFFLNRVVESNQKDFRPSNEVTDK